MTWISGNIYKTGRPLCSMFWKKGVDFKHSLMFFFSKSVTQKKTSENSLILPHCSKESSSFFVLFYALFRNSFPDQNDSHEQMQLWATVSSALCGSVNNPQNGRTMLLDNSIHHTLKPKLCLIFKRLLILIYTHLHFCCILQRRTRMPVRVCFPC